MVVSLRRWFERFKFMLLFVAFTYVLYHLFSYVSAWVEPDKYRQPEGRAVKAFNYEDIPGYNNASFIDRLRFYYWYGE